MHPIASILLFFVTYAVIVVPHSHGFFASRLDVEEALAFGRYWVNTWLALVLLLLAKMLHGALLAISEFRRRRAQTGCMLIASLILSTASLRPLVMTIPIE